MDQRSIKLLIVAFILVGVIVAVVSFNISAKHHYFLSTTSAISITTDFDENNSIKTTISSLNGNCLVDPNSLALNSSYRATKRNYQDSVEIEIPHQDNFTLLCWTLNRNCYCFFTSGKKSYKWHEADQYCRGENMILLSLESEEEDELIYNHIESTPKLRNELYWTSGQHSLRWEWGSGESFNYTNWKTEKKETTKETEYLTYLYLDTNYNFENGYWLETFNSRLHQSSDNISSPRGMGFICESHN